jgi:hypothetical protein
MFESSAGDGGSPRHMALATQTSSGETGAEVKSSLARLPPATPQPSPRPCAKTC